ncbi:MAG: nicotinate-nucleotide adenylyltransferase [bacterium]
MQGLIHIPRIGILGGTFNPVHLGHLVIAQDAIEHFELSRVLLIPCARPPHKPSAELAPSSHRLAMLEHAVEGDLHFEVSDMEITREGVSYTIDTLRILAAVYPGVELCFIIGSDSLPELYLWRDIEALLGLCRVVTLARPGVDLAALRAMDLKLSEARQTRIRAHIRTGHLLNVSSSEIRYRVAEGMSIRYLVPPGVEMYIAEHSLYRR